MSLPETASSRSAGLWGLSGIRSMVLPRRSREDAVPVGRDLRLDVFRGIALVMIFINHVPGTVYESYTSRNFGFSDAAEAFVFMSGVAAGLAYSNNFRTGNLWAAIAKVWARARQLYFVHITITMLSLGIIAAAARYFDLPEVLTKNNVAPLFKQPLSALIGMPLLSHQLGYLNILPLYVTLLLATPLFLFAGLRKPWLVLVGSIVLWCVAGQFRINLPSFPNSGGWFFNPFSWQIVFVIGLLSGAAMKVGKPFIPYHRALFGLAAAFVAVALLWVRIPDLGRVGGAVLAGAAQAGTPFYIVGFDKTFLSLPRLLHALALFYLLGNMPLMQAFAQSRIAAPFRLLGRQGLPVFAAGTVICILLQMIKTSRDPDMMFDGAIVGLGLLALLALAWILNYTAALRTSGKARTLP